MSENEFRTQAALHALNGLLSNSDLHSEKMTFQNLASEAWAIAEEMWRSAPAPFWSESREAKTGGQRVAAAPVGFRFA